MLGGSFAELRDTISTESVLEKKTNIYFPELRNLKTHRSLFDGPAG